MGSHPLNLALRFVLELVLLWSVGRWGFTHGEGFFAILYSILFPILVMALWVTFAVPNDPSRSGNAPIPVAGWIRLLLEIALFGFGIAGFYSLGDVDYAYWFGCISIFHYLISYDRIKWLLKQNQV